MKAETVKWLSVVATVLLVGYLFLNNYKLRQIVQNYEHVAALNEAHTDSLRTSFNKKTGEWESSRKAYLAEKAVLDKFLDEKEQELAKLRRKGADTGGQVSGETRVDTVVVTKILPDSITRVATINALPHYEAAVTSTPDSTRIKLMAYTNLTWDISKGEINVSHNNPYLTITNTKAFYVTPKQKKSNWKWIAGGIIGAGVTYFVVK
jgi:hypothetical protein